MKPYLRQTQALTNEFEWKKKASKNSLVISSAFKTLFLFCINCFGQLELINELWFLELSLSIILGFIFPLPV